MHKKDWLLSRGFAARIEERPDGICLTNGIIAREFVLRPDFTMVSFKNLFSGEEFMRAVCPEATLTIQGRRYPVGGAQGQSERAFFRPEWLDGLTAGAQGFHYVSHKQVPITRVFSWASKRPCRAITFPPAGVGLEVTFRSDAEALDGIEVVVGYELYDDLAATGKYLRVTNHSGARVMIDRFQSEIIAVFDPEDTTMCPALQPDGTQFVWEATNHNLFASSDFENTMVPTFRYHADPEYTSQVNYGNAYPSMLISQPQIGPRRAVEPGGSFTTYTAYVMLHAEADRQRRSLEIARFYDTLAPWTSQNPMYLHVVSDDEQVLCQSIDQCAEVGLDMLIISFGSGLDMEDVSDKNIGKFKRIADYAHSKGIEIGGYSLLASRRIDNENDIINAQPIFGHSPCLGSEWGIHYFEKIRMFMEKTGFDVFEHDGSYPGDTCRSTRHPGHECFEDSLYTQLEQITGLYRWMRERDMYLTVPDCYFLSGNTKICMGYKEVNWALPREQQTIIARQNIYDGTLLKSPTMGWMFVPLTRYHHGGPDSTIEPLCDHLAHYRMMLLCNLLAGVQACYRGKRLYDTPETREMVRECVALYRRYRDILEAPMVRIRRPDGRRIDGYVHVQPEGERRGLAAFFNPRDIELTEEIAIPLHYTGLTGSAEISLHGEKPQRVALNERGEAVVRVTVKPQDCAYYVIRA